jgi:hypothetical protein
MGKLGEIGEVGSLLLACLLVALLIRTLISALQTGSITWIFDSALSEPFLVTRVKHPRTFRLLVALNSLMIIVISAVVLEALNL